jgi:hypothetical protein
MSPTIRVRIVVQALHYLVDLACSQVKRPGRHSNAAKDLTEKSLRRMMKTCAMHLPNEDPMANKTPLVGEAPLTEQFTHPLMHVIEADNRLVIFTEEFAEKAWLNARHRFKRAGLTYEVVDTQIGNYHYYVWVRRVEGL